MKLEMNKQYGPALLNLLRQTAMTSVNVIKPIAFAVGDTSNVIDTSDAVAEDMTSFIHNVMSVNYMCPENIERTLYVCEIDAVASLSTRQLQQFGVYATTDKILLHLLSKAHVTIIFRCGRGNYSAKQNIAFLAESGVDTNSLVVVASRHSALDSFTHTEIESEDSYITDINITSQITTDRRILENSLAVIEHEVAELRKKLTFD